MIKVFGKPNIRLTASRYALQAMDPTHEALGAQVRRLAKRRGLSLNHLADRAGVARGTLSDVLNGKQSPTLTTLVKVAGALNLPVGALFELEPDPPKRTL